MNPETHEFVPYSADRLLEIVNARIKQAYAKNFADKESLMRLCEFVAEHGGNARYLFSLFLDATELMSRNSARLSMEIDEIIEHERRKELKGTLEEMRVNTPTKFELLNLINSSAKPSIQVA